MNDGIPDGIELVVFKILLYNQHIILIFNIMGYYVEGHWLSSVQRTRAAHEARLRSAREEFQAAEAALLAHGYPLEPSAVVDEEIIIDMDARLESMKGARTKFREARDETA